MAKKYIDADRLRAEIENLIEEYSSIKAKGVLQKGYKGGRLIGYEDALNKLDSLQQEQPEQPTRGYDEAYLNEKIAKATKSWDGVDVDKFMDEVRGREPEVDLEKETKSWILNECGPSDFSPFADHWCADDIMATARHFYELGKNSK